MHAPAAAAPGARAAFAAFVAAPLLVFAVLAERIEDGRAFAWDHRLLHVADVWYAANRTTAAVLEVAVIGTIVVGALVALAVLVALLVRGRGRQALFWVLVVGGVLALDVALKEVFRRPALVNEESGYSFPSGNAMASAAVIAAAVLLLPTGRRWLVGLIGAAAAGLYGALLVLLYWHYPSDVVAGWCVALAWVTAVWLALRPDLRPRNALERGEDTAAAGER
jgi:undecaprenyl-diphosphatase